MNGASGFTGTIKKIVIPANAGTSITSLELRLSPE
jgi:hypothetical protein